jgi:hypothetical protein
MPLPSTGTISLGQVNTELGRSATASINMNDAAVRTLAGVGGSGTAISMQNLRGKSAFSLGFNNAENFSVGGTLNYDAGLYINADGSITVTSGSARTGPTAYGSPIFAGVGADYEARMVNWIYKLDGGSSGSFTGLGVFVDVGDRPTPATTGWINLGTNRSIVVATSQGDKGFATLTLEIRKIGTTTPVISRPVELLQGITPF